MSEEIIQKMIKLLKAESEYKTVIIGLLAGDKTQVQVTEREFDRATNDLLSKNLFIKLSGFTSFKNQEAEES